MGRPTLEAGHVAGWDHKTVFAAIAGLRVSLVADLTEVGSRLVGSMAVEIPPNAIVAHNM